jgi:hypothetical protein
METREAIQDAAARARGMAERGGDQARATAQTAAERAKEATAGVVGAVKEKVQDVAAGASDLAGKAKDTAQAWASSVGSAAVQVKDKAMEVASAAAETVGHLGQDVTGLIRRYPVSALLMGLGVGFLLGRLLPRGSSGRV